MILLASIPLPNIPLSAPVTWALIGFGALFGAVQLGMLYRRRTRG